MRFSFTIILFIFFSLSQAQNISDRTFFTGTVIDASTRQPMIGANVINLTQLKGDATGDNGMFSLPAKINDSIIVTFLGYKTVNILVNANNINHHQTIHLQKKPIELDEVIISATQLTGRLPIDIYLIPVQEPIDIAPSITAMFGSRKETRLSKINDALKKIMNPVDLIYNIFSTRAKDMRRLKLIQNEEKVRDILASKFDREILSRLLRIDKKDVYLVLEMCDYPEQFILKANDLQILEAILNCYSKYDMYIKD